MKNEGHSNLSPTLKAVIGFFLLIFMGFAIYGFFFGDKPNISYKKKALKLEFTNDTISEKYIDFDNHAIPRIKIGRKYMGWIKDNWRDSIEVGDTINKLKNSLIFTINKKNGKMYTFNYQVCIDELDSLGYIH